MPWDNSENPAKGRTFEHQAADAMAAWLGVPFHIEVPTPIGDPPKHHKFDLVSHDGRFVAECKCYSWTETGNIPSAKMGFVNEAVFYLSHLPAGTERFVVLRKDEHPRRTETLADYYHRTNRHLLGGVRVLELDPVTMSLREIR